MPINRLFRDGKIKPEDLARLDKAFTFTLKSLNLVDRNDPVCDLVGQKVVELDTAGVRDPKEIATRAARELGIPQ